MALEDDDAGNDKTNLYRAGVDMPPLARNDDADSVKASEPTSRPWPHADLHPTANRSKAAPSPDPKTGAQPRRLPDPTPEDIITRTELLEHHRPQRALGNRYEQSQDLAATRP